MLFRLRESLIGDTANGRNQLPRKVGSNRSRNQSPSRQNAREVRKIVTAGKTAIHQAVNRKSRPKPTILPRLVFGG